jgi:hypothetical protein
MSQFGFRAAFRTVSFAKTQSACFSARQSATGQLWVGCVRLGRRSMEGDSTGPWWTAFGSTARASSPSAAQPVAMPADDGVRLHDNQRRAPVRPNAREGQPKESVAEPEAASRRSVVRRQLLPERNVLQDQFPLAAKHQGECTDDHDEQLQHVRSWLDSARKFNSDGFGKGQRLPCAGPRGEYVDARRRREGRPPQGCSRLRPPEAHLRGPTPRSRSTPI